MEQATHTSIKKVLAPLFFMTIAGATYYLATATSPIVPLEVPLGFAKALPIQYWVLLILIVLLFTVSIAARSIPYLWASVIAMTIFVPGLGSLINAYPRDYFATVATDYISKSGFFNPLQHIFLNFPGSEIAFSSIAILTKVDSVSVIRAYGLCYNLLVLGICYVSYRRFGVSQVAALVGSLALVLGFYSQGVLIYSSLNGFVFYLIIASLILMPYANRTVNMMLLTLFFAAMIITHAFSPFLTIAGAVGILLGGDIVNKIITHRTGLSLISRDLPRASRSTVIIFLLMTTVFWAYIAFGPFSAGLLAVSSINLASLSERALSPLLTPQTVYERSYASVARLYAPILFVAFIIYLKAVPDKRRLQMFLLTLGLGGAILIALAGYAAEFLPRVFTFALLPLCYGVCKLFEYRSRLLKAVALIALVLVLGLHIPAHYGQDAFQTYQTSNIRGIEYIAQHSHPNSTFDAITRDFSWNYYYNVYRTNVSDRETGGFYHVMSYPATNWETYSRGDNATAQLISEINSSAYNTVYSNGLFTVYE